MECVRESVLCLCIRVMMAEAVAVIESWWWNTKNRKVFRILKETVRSAVSSILNSIVNAFQHIFIM